MPQEETTRAFLLLTLLRVSIFCVTGLLTVKLLMKHIDPTNKRKANAAKSATELLSRLGLKVGQELTEYELMIANHLVDPSSITVSWNSIGGLKTVIQEIHETVILPIKKKELFSNSQLTQPPKGVLLHGPPGCGKTMIAKATAREAGCNFINLDLSILTDKWYGESQKLAAAVFSLAVKLQPCIIFIDEIDSFLRSRNVQDHEATAMMKAQFMTLWDGLNTDPGTTVIVMGATNRPHDLDKAILRRMPATFHISLPTLSQRQDILKLVMAGEPLAENVDLSRIATLTDSFSGSDLKELCRNASLYRVRDYCSSQTLSDIQSGGDMAQSEDQEEFHDTLRPITMDDLVKSMKKMKDSKEQIYKALLLVRKHDLVYNCDETWLNWKAFLQKTLALTDEDIVPNVQQSNDGKIDDGDEESEFNQKPATSHSDAEAMLTMCASIGLRDKRRQMLHRSYFLKKYGTLP